MTQEINTLPRRRRRLAPAIALILASAAAGSLDASARPLAPPPETAPSQPVMADPISVDVDKARVIVLPKPASAVFVANPDIADVQAHDPQRVIVFGKKIGSTTVYAFAGGRVTGYPVTVTGAAADAQAAVQAHAPKASLEVTRQPGGLVVSGQASSPAEAATIKAVAQQFLGDKDKLALDLALRPSTQVNLQVRVAEVSRTASKSFGFNWDALFNNGTVAVGLLTGRQPASALGAFIRDTSASQLDSIGIGYKSGSFDVSGVIDALQAEGLATMLAEPNLTAVSGESASFLAGGEFPVPVGQGLDQVTIEWKKFGVSLDFTPTVLSGDRISIRVRPEVSEVSDIGGVVINNTRVPGVSVRRADTTVELASGQSFAIAGLFQNTASNSVSQYPWLGDLPVLGTLFRSSSFQRNESELVIIVTPYIVRPAASPAELHLPTDGVVMSNDLERVLSGRLAAAPAGRPHLSGPAGFMLEDKP